MKKHILSAILLTAGVLLCSCKMNLSQNGANIKISLPYGSARAADDTKYSFKVDCFTGSEITDSPAYSQDGESGKEILFKDVIPSVYTVRVRAFEYNNFDNLLYEGQDTKNVVEGAVTNFLITMNKLKFKGNIKNLNTVYLQYHVDNPKQFRFMHEGRIEAKTICENGVTPVNYDWYFGDLYLKPLSGSDKNTIDLEAVKNYLEEINFGQGEKNLFYMVIVKFSNGNYANYSFNNYLEMIVEEFYDDEIFNEVGYNAFLMTAKPVPKYTKSDKSSKGTIKYTYSFNDDGEMSHEEMSSNISFYKIDGEFPELSDYWTKGTLVPNKDELIFEYTRDLPEDYYIVKIGLFQSGNYVMDCYDMIYVQNGYITEAVFKDGMYFGDPGQGGGGSGSGSGEPNPGSGGGTYTTVQSLMDSNTLPERGNTYSISNENELRQLSTWMSESDVKGFANITFVLKNSITLSSDFAPIGSDTETPFMGKFDGQGNTISGLNITVAYNNKPSALFGYVGVTDTVKRESPDWIPTIQNLSVEGSITVSAKESYSGGIVGYIIGYALLDNCIANVDITNNKSGATELSVGGICGKINDFTKYGINTVIKNCINIGDLTGNMHVGGIVGDVSSYTDIYNCANYGNITYTQEQAGGLVGTAVPLYLNKMQNCYNAGSLSGPTEPATEETYATYGALVGGDSYINDDGVSTLYSKIDYCYYLSSACSVEIAGITNSECEFIKNFSDGKNAIMQLNENITNGNADISDAKKWSTTPVKISEKTVYLFEK